MRQFIAAAIVIVAVGGLQVAAQDGKSCELKGAHICCKQCVKIVSGILEKVEGLSDVKVDQSTKTVTCTAKDKATAEKALAAMYTGGFAATGKYGDATISYTVPKQSNSKAKEVTVKDVHVCCGQCKAAIKKLFKGAEVKYEGTGPQLDVTVSGDDLTPAGVLKALNDSGFHGKIGK
jgi:copper chaperone CopZ